MANDIEYGEEGGILAAIKEGMDVYDVEGDDVGEVEFVYFGTMQVDDTGVAVEPATTTGAGTASWVERLDDILALDDADAFPEVVAERLLRKGFVRVDEGFLSGADRFIFPEQIAGVDEDGVHLRVEADDLAEGW